MLFSDIIGQEEAIERLRGQVASGRIPHAQLLTGREGYGAMPLAIAFAHYLLCQGDKDSEACQMCHSCKMISSTGYHPDLHYVFPVVNRSKSAQKTRCEDLLDIWNEQIRENPYFSLEEWMERLQVENQQPVIYTQESDFLSEKLMLKSSQGGFKIAIIYLPERMAEEGANKILKLLEEPPEQTVFLLVSQRPEMLLDTIISRCQRISLKPIPEAVIGRELAKRMHLGQETAARIAHNAEGSWLRALEQIHINDEREAFLSEFMQLMRLAYSRNVRGLRQWSEEISSWGRERQKGFLSYCQTMVRENFIYNFRLPQLSYMDEKEEQFSRNFSRFVNERNIAVFLEELGEATRQIQQNVNAKMVLFDLSLRIMQYIRV